jgi:hypothetical protein
VFGINALSATALAFFNLRSPIFLESKFSTLNPLIKTKPVSGLKPILDKLPVQESAAGVGLIEENNQTPLSQIRDGNVRVEGRKFNNPYIGGPLGTGMRLDAKPLIPTGPKPKK